MSLLFRPIFTTSEKISDASNIVDGQFLIDINTGLMYVDYNSQRLKVGTSINHFQFNSSTSGYSANANGGFSISIQKSDLGITGNLNPIIQLFDSDGYEIGSSSDMSIRWNDN